MRGFASGIMGLCLMAAVALRPAPASARGGLHWAELDELQAAFDFLVGIDIERYQVHGLGVPAREAEKVFLGQRLGGYGEGSFVHPKLWYWRALVDVLFIEDIVGGDLAGISVTNYPAAPVQSGDRFAVEPEYDVQFTFLQDHPYPIVAYSTRRTHLVRREFMSNYWLNTLTAGASAGWHNKDFPFSVQYSYLLNEGDERELTAGAEQHQVYATGQNQSEASRTSVEYRFTDYHNRNFPETDYAFHYGYALASFDLDEDDDYRIDTSARAQHRDFQMFTQDEVRGTVQFVGRLVPPLRLRIQSDVAWWNLDAQDGIQTVVWTDVRHQLFDSLTTTVLGRFVYDKGEETERKEGTASGAITYRKDLGPVVMTHGYLAAGTWTEFGAASGMVEVLDEPVSLEGEILSPLAWPNVDEGSLVLLDSTRTVRFQRDLDFRVERRGSITYLRRTTGGDIPDGATVLVSYEYEVSGSSRSQQLDQQYYARLETDLWDFFKLYGQYIFRDDKRWVDRGEDLFLTWHEAVAGVDAGGDGARVAAEYHYVTSEHYTAHQVSVGTSYAIPILMDFQPLLGMRELYLAIDITNERKNLLEIYSESTYPIWGPITGEWHLSYQWEDGGPNDGQYLFGNTKVTWTIRKILLWLEYEVALERKERQSYDRHAITFNVRRMF